MMQSGQATFNLLQIELQQKSPTILSKVTNGYNKIKIHFVITINNKKVISLQ
jgi:hypothetical protein